MSELSRIGVAIDSELLEKFDQLINKRGYTNRSEAFRDLIRDELVQKTWESPESNVVGTVTLVYDHHVRMLSEKLTDLQHDFHRAILPPGRPTLKRHGEAAPIAGQLGVKVISLSITHTAELGMAHVILEG